MPIPLLPGELTDRIIDHLHDDPATLRALALAARAFLPAARAHRFRAVRIRNPRERARLRAARSTVGPLVRELLMADWQWLAEYRLPEAYLQNLTGTLEKAKGADEAWGENMLLPRLRALALAGLPWTRVPLDTMPARILGLAGARSLALHGCAFVDLAQLAALVTTFPMLEAFTLGAGNTFVRPVNPTTLQGKKHGLRLRRIRLLAPREPPARIFAEWYSSCAEVTSQLTALGALELGGSTGGVVDILLRAAGASLITLRLHTSGVPVEDATLDLRMNTYLSTLTIEARFPGAASNAVLHAVLAQLPNATALRNLVIRVRAPSAHAGSSAVAALGWRTIMDLLAGQFPPCAVPDLDMMNEYGLVHAGPGSSDVLASAGLERVDIVVVGQSKNQELDLRALADVMAAEMFIARMARLAGLSGGYEQPTVVRNSGPTPVLRLGTLNGSGETVWTADLNSTSEGARL